MERPASLRSLSKVLRPAGSGRFGFLNQLFVSVNRGERPITASSTWPRRWSSRQQAPQRAALLSTTVSGYAAFQMTPSTRFTTVGPHGCGRPEPVALSSVPPVDSSRSHDASSSILEALSVRPADPWSAPIAGSSGSTSSL